MGFNNPSIPWSELERKLLSDQRRPGGPPRHRRRRRQPRVVAQARTVRRRRGHRAPAGPIVPYAELHAHSTFSFLDGASTPEELAEEARAPRPARPRDHRPRRLLRHRALRRGGRELRRARRRCSAPSSRSGSPSRRTASADPAGAHLLVLARRRRATTASRPRSPRASCGRREGAPHLRPRASSPSRRAATGWCSPDAARARCGVRSPTAGADAACARARPARRALRARRTSYVELIDHGNPLDTRDNDVLAGLAARARAAAARHQQRALRRPAASSGSPPRVAAVRAQPQPRRARRLAARASPGAHLRIGRRDGASASRGIPGAVARTVTLADELAFPLRRAKPALPQAGGARGPHADVVAAAARVGGGAAQVPRPARRRPRAHREASSTSSS